MTAEEPNVILIFKKAKEDTGLYRMFSLTSDPKKTWNKSFWNPFPAVQRKGGDGKRVSIDLIRANNAQPT